MADDAQVRSDSVGFGRAGRGGEGSTSSRPLFRGTFLHSLDDKGRVSFPSEFRNVLAAAPRIILTNFITDGARCLDGYSAEGWLEFESKIRDRGRFDPQVRKLENFYLARAAECAVDSSGRIHIPEHLRTYAGLQKEIVFTGSLHGFRVWDKRVWDLVFQESESALLDNPALFKGIDVD